MSTQDKVKKGQRKSSFCGHFMADWDDHHYCPKCRDDYKGDDPCANSSDCLVCSSFSDLESAADNLFTSPPRPQPLPFSSLSIKTPAKTVPPTPGTALQQKIELNLEKSLGNTLNIHL